MNNLSTYITEAFREVQSQQVIDVDKLGKGQPKNIPAALPSMYAYLQPLSDYYNGPTEYYADDDTLDIFDEYFSRNENYHFIVNSDAISLGVDFFVKTDNNKYSFKVLLSSDEVRINDYACIIPYKDDGHVNLLQNDNIDYLIWKEPNRNELFLFKRKSLLKYLETAEIKDNLIRIQKVKDRKDTSVFRISKSALTRMMHDTDTEVLIKLSLRNKEVFIGDDLEKHLDEIKNQYIRKTQ